MPLDLVARANAIVQHLAQFDVWVPGFAGATVDATPAMVSLLDLPPHAPSTYAILTVRRGAGITGRILLDPGSADLLEVRAVQQPGATLPPFVDPVNALRHDPSTAALDLTTLRHRLVWQYSLESGSRFQPFWSVSLAGHAPLYVRIDGTVFTSLTPV